MLLNFGHTIIEPDSRACACGSKGCLQSIAWPPGIVRTALELLAKDTSSRLHGITVPLSSELILEAVYAGDVVAKGPSNKPGEGLEWLAQSDQPVES